MNPPMNPILTAHYLLIHFHPSSTSIHAPNRPQSISSVHLESELASNYGRSGHYRRTVVNFDYSGTSITNATFETDFCPKIASNTEIFLTRSHWNSSLPYYVIPNCLSSASLTYFRATDGFLFSNGFADLPRSLQTLLLSDKIAIFPSSTPTHDDGFDGVTGLLDWDEFFVRFPNLTSLRFANFDIFGPAFPSSIPSRFTSFVIQGVGLAGTISSTLFQNYTGTTSIIPVVQLENTQLSGSIPSGLFDPFSSVSQQSVSFNWRNNRLNGSLPVGLFDPFADLGSSSFVMGLDSNMISSQLPENLFPNGMVRSAGTFQFFYINNSLTGSLPATTFSGLAGAKLNSFTVNFATNNLSGLLPTVLFPPGMLSDTLANFVFFATSNSISGTISPQFLTSMVNTSNVTLASFVLDLSSNRLIGSIPETLFSNGTGALGLLLRTAIISLKNNSLNGSIPPSLFNTFSLTSLVNLDFQQNQLSGSPPLICNSNTASKLDMSSKKLNGSVPSSWNTCSIASTNTCCTTWSWRSSCQKHHI